MNIGDGNATLAGNIDSIQDQEMTVNIQIPRVSKLWTNLAIVGVPPCSIINQIYVDMSEKTLKSLWPSLAFICEFTSF